MLATVLTELEDDTNSPTDEFLSNMLNVFGLFSGKSLGSGRRLANNGSLEWDKFTRIALHDEGVDAESKEVSSDTMNASYSLKSE